MSDEALGPGPVFRVLERQEAEQLLSRARVARIAYVAHDRVDLEPIHIVYEDGWIYARTSPGTKLRELAHHPWVALEGDEIRGDFDWASVVAKGTVYFVDDDPSPHGVTLRQTATAALHRAFPAAFTTNDPTPARTIVIRVHVDELAGRAAASSAPE